MRISKSENVDVLREIALLLVMTSHFWEMISKSKTPKDPILRSFFGMSGTAGVTLFFLISGFGIYISLSNMEKNGGISWKCFLRRRMIRILPEYYIALAGSLVILIGVGRGDEISVGSIVTHLLLIHNLFPAYAMSISVPLWAMGVIVHFYLLAIPLYYGVKKSPFLTLLLSIVVSVGFQTLLIKAYPPEQGPPLLLFWEKRQLLLSVVDHFVPGMAAAHIFLKNDEQKLSPRLAGLLFIALLIAVLFVTRFGWKKMTYLKVPLYPSAYALLLAALLFVILYIRVPEGFFLHRALRFLSKGEYAAYLWHYSLGLVWTALFSDVLVKPAFLVRLLLYIIYVASALLIGWVSLGIIGPVVNRWKEKCTGDGYEI